MVLIDLGHSEQGAKETSSSPFYVLKFGFLSFGFLFNACVMGSEFFVLVCYIEFLLFTLNLWYLCVLWGFGFCLLHWVLGFCALHQDFVACIGSLVSNFYKVHWV
jgi:hypothetical protein